MKVLASPCLLLASCLAQLLLMMARRLVLMKLLSSWISLRLVSSLPVKHFYCLSVQVQPAKEDFYPIADMVCRGREMVDMLPEIPDYYEYGSELIFHWSHKHGEDTHMHKLISPRNNW